MLICNLVNSGTYPECCQKYR